MKTLLTLLFSGLSISAATLYPVMTDSANRTFPGGVTNVFFLNSNVVTTGTMRATGVLTLTNSGNVFAGDGSGLTGVGAGTNGPLLNGTNVFTGTNTFTAENFYPANNIGVRHLYTQSTNISIASTAVSATPLTNNGDFSLTSQLLEYDMPALLGSNSLVELHISLYKTTAQPASLSMCVYVGTNTNSIYYQATLANTSAGVAVLGIPFSGVFYNFRSFSSQQAYVTSSWPGGLADARNLYPSNYTDTSSSWKMRIGIWSTTANTNIVVTQVRVNERPAP